MKGAGAAPRLTPRLQVYYKAFLDLHKRRQWHQSGPQPITYQEILAYVQVKFPLKSEQLRRFALFVEEMDTTYIKDYSK